MSTEHYTLFEAALQCATLGRIDQDSRAGAMIYELSKTDPTKPGWQIIAEVLARKSREDYRDNTKLKQALKDFMSAALLAPNTPDRMVICMWDQGKLCEAFYAADKLLLNKANP